ncbi:MAG: DUF4126 family protein [Tepidisphaera sp.]|nr:DUF4126 family protein [Tepidisphaera sp.]
MDTALGLCVGVALAAACGFRVFVPLLVMAIGARTGVISLGHGFEFLASWPALLALGVATVVECVASVWPWLDHALDLIATPCAVLAGTLITASQIDHMHPVLMWGTGLVAGGGAAGLTQAATVTTRGASTVTTAGLLNPVINATQTLIATVLSVLAIVVPAVAVACVVGVFGVAAWWWVRRGARRAAIAPNGRDDQSAGSREQGVSLEVTGGPEARRPSLTYVDAA